jgi:hypothetical protein
MAIKESELKDALDEMVETAEAEDEALLPKGPISILSDEVASTLSTYLKSELDVVESERTVREDQWAEWRRMRLSQPESDSKSFPWENASNVEVPVMQAKINIIFSKFNKAFGSKVPFWTISSSVPELKEAAKAGTKYLEYYGRNPYGLNIGPKRREIIYDCITFGTEVVRVPFLEQTRRWKVPSSTGGAASEAETRTMVTHNGPALIPIKIEDFFIHPYWDDLQRAPWCAIKYRLTMEELRQREAEGIYENVDKIISQAITELDDNEAEELRRRGLSADGLNNVTEFQLWDIYEVRVFWDIDNDGQLEDCILYYEPKSGVFLRSEYNPLPFRDIVVLRFLNIPGQFYGLGEGEILQHLQKEITSTHNRRADNQTLAMMQVWKQKRGRGLIEDGQIYPGAVLKVDEADDVMPFEFPDLSASSVQSESIARAYADEASGASSPLAGIADPVMKSGAGASSTMFLAQQSGDMLSSISDNLSDDFSSIGLMIVQQLVANVDDVGMSPLSDNERREFSKILSLNPEELPHKLQFEVHTTDISQTKDAQKQNLLTVSQIYTGWATNMLQLAAQMTQIQAQNAFLTPSGRMVASILVGGTDLMKRVLEFFGIENLEDYIPSMDDLKIKMEVVDAQIEAQAAQVALQLEQQGGTSGGAENTPGLGSPVPGAQRGLGQPGPGNPGQQAPGGAAYGGAGGGNSLGA